MKSREIMISQFKIENKLKNKKVSKSQNKQTSPHQKSYQLPETKKTKFPNKGRHKANYFYRDIRLLKS